MIAPLMTDDDFEKLRRERLAEKVSEAFEDRDDVTGRLEALGFEWVDDESDQEEAEERLAKPKDARQEYLVRYFEGLVVLDEEVLRAYLAERASSAPNYPLIRKYYKQGNERLKDLLLFGLSRDQVNKDLLSDLAFFHEFSDVRLDLTQHYLWACEAEKDLSHFKQLVLDFYYDTLTDDFDALYQLGHKFAPDSRKGQVVRDIVEQLREEPDLLI